MPIELIKEEANILSFKVSGEVSQEEINDTLGIYEEQFTGEPSPRMIFEIEANTSLSKDSDWSHKTIKGWVDGCVRKIAIVGPREVRESTGTYSRMGVREAGIRYFESEEEGQLSAWIISNDY
jgi:hypothetical protein